MVSTVRSRSIALTPTPSTFTRSIAEVSESAVQDELGAGAHAARHLAEDPGIGALEPFLERDAGNPVEHFANKHEAARLFAVPPDLDLVGVLELRLDHLAADRRRRLLAPARGGAVRPIDVVISHEARLETAILAEMPAHALAEELLPAVTVLRLGGIGIGLPQRNDSAHVGGEVIDRGGPVAGCALGQIAYEVLRAGSELEPFAGRLAVDAADPQTARQGVSDEVAADEPARPRDDDE